MPMTTHEWHAGDDLDDAVTFQRDMYLYWWAARELGELLLTSRGFLARPTLRRLRAQWPVSDGDRAEADEPRLYFLRRLLERLGLLRVPSESQEGMAQSRSSRLVAAEYATMARFLAHPLAERLRICTRLWVAGGWWPDGKPSGTATGLHTPVQPRIALARRRLIEVLAATEPGSPIEIPGVPTISTRAPRIIGATAARRKPRDIAEDRNEAMRAALIGPLHWMGLVVSRDEGASGERRLVASSGVLALRSDPDDNQLQAAPGRVIVQPNLDVLAYQPLTAPALFTLDTCATRVSLERVARYRLTKDGAIRAQQLGWSEDDIARRLEALSGGTLPGNVRVRLADWVRSARRLQVTSPATVLTTASPAALDALLADRAAHGWVLRRLGPKMALIQTEEIESVRRWLLARGELPAVEHAGR